jgi:hypothetical protein
MLGERLLLRVRVSPTQQAAADAGSHKGFLLSGAKSTVGDGMSELQYITDAMEMLGTGYHREQSARKTCRYSFGWKKVGRILKKTGGKCFYCGCTLPPDTNYFDDGGNVVESCRNWDVDHVIPLCRGGGNELDNLVPACQICNRKKGAK